MPPGGAPVPAAGRARILRVTGARSVSRLRCGGLRRAIAGSERQASRGRSARSPEGAISRRGPAMLTSLIDRSACPQDAQPVGPALGVHAPRVQPLIYVHRPDLMVGLRGPGAPLHSGLGPLAHDPDDDRPPRPGQAQGGDEESQRHPSGMRLSDERRGTGRGTAPRGLGCPSWQGSSSEPTGAGRAMHSSSAQAPTTAGGAPAVERRGGTLRPTTQRPRAKTMRSGRTKLSRGTQQLVGGLPAFVGLG